MTSPLHIEALDDMWAFAELIDYRGGVDTFSQLHRDMCDFVTTPQRIMRGQAANRRRLTLVAREHRKSTINTVLYTMWRLYRNPNLRFAVGSNVKKLSQAFIRELRFYFENEDLQEYVWNNRPHIKGRLVPHLYKGSKVRKGDDDTDAADRKVVWNQYMLQLVRTEIFKEPSVEAVSVGMSLTGAHYDIVILDDIVDWDNCSTAVKAGGVEEWAEDLESVLTKTAVEYDVTPHFQEMVGDELIINGTPYYKWDYYHSHFLGKTFKFGENHDELEANLSDKEYICFIRNIYKNGKNPEEGYTFPELFNDIVVKRLRARIKKKRFSAQYLLQVTGNDDDERLNSDSVKLILEKDIIKDGYGLITYIRNPIEQKQIRLYMVIDLAISQAKTADNSCIGIGGYDDEGNFYLVDVFAKRVAPSELINQIYRIADKWNISVVHVEKGGYQEAFAHQLRAEFLKPERRPLVVMPYYHGGNKKERITNQLEPLISNGMLYTHGWILHKTPLSEELEYHPSEDTTDDVIDVTATLAEKATITVQQKATEKQTRTRHLVVNTRYGGQR